MRALAVVVLDVVAKNTLKMASPCDQQPVETLLAHAANETLGVGVRLWRADRCVDDADPLAAEHLVEGGGELAVAVVDEEPRPLEQVGEAEVAGLLGDPAAGRVRGAAGKVDAAAAYLKKEQHVKAAESDRLDGEEIARQHARRLLAQECPPAQLRTPRRGLKASSREHSPNCARRNREAELQQLAGDPLIAPPGVLARKPQYQPSQLAVERRTAHPFRRLRPPAPHQLAMPAQQRLRRHRQLVSPPIRKQTRKRGDEGAIGRLQPGALASSAKHRELMAKHDQFDVLVELTAAAPDEQPQDRSERKVGEGK